MGTAPARNALESPNKGNFRDRHQPRRRDCAWSVSGGRALRLRVRAAISAGQRSAPAALRNLIPIKVYNVNR